MAWILDSKQQWNFGEIRKFLVKQEINKLPFRQEKTRKWHAHISANAIKIRFTDSNPAANNGNDLRTIGIHTFPHLKSIK